MTLKTFDIRFDSLNANANANRAALRQEVITMNAYLLRFDLHRHYEFTTDGLLTNKKAKPTGLE